MRFTRELLVFLFLFIGLMIAVRILGIPEMSLDFIIAFVLSLVGFSSVYYGFDFKSKLLIFIGSTVFMGGFFLFLIDTFFFSDISMLIVPAVLMVLAVNSMLLFIADTSQKVYLLMFAGFAIVTAIYIHLYGRIDFTEIYIAGKDVVQSYWFLAALILISFLIILVSEMKEERRKKEAEEKSSQEDPQKKDDALMVIDKEEEDKKNEGSTE